VSETLLLGAFSASIACLVLGVMLGRIITLRGVTWTLKDAIGIVLIGAFITVLMVLFWKEIPEKNEQLIVYMLGQLSGFVAGVVSSHYVNKAGEDRLSEKRTEASLAQAKSTEALATAVASQTAPHTNSVGDPVADDERPTGAPGDPVHVKEEK
jgi:cytoskeletal protein RodZ